MRSVRDQFIPFFSRILRPPELINTPFSLQEEGTVVPREVTNTSSLRQLHKWMSAPERRTTVQSILWVVLVIVTAFMSGFLWGAAKVFGWGHIVPASGTAVLWGILFGVAVLFFLPSKTVITVWGCLLGTSLDKAVTGTGILKSASQAIVSSTSILVANTPLDEQLTRLALWIFLATFGVLCLPAFFRD